MALGMRRWHEALGTPFEVYALGASLLLALHVA